MSLTLVTYFSLTGNTKTIAESIHEALHGEKIIRSVKELDDIDLETCDLIFVGFPVHSHSVPYPVENFIRMIPKGKKIALFSTHGSLTGSLLSREALEHAAALTSQVQIIGTFTCRGKVSPKALDVLHKSPEHTSWSEIAVSARTHPDKHDMEDAKSFANWIQSLASHQ